jgi:hypothetical protein
MTYQEPNYLDLTTEDEGKRTDLKKGDKFTLECGHKGRVVWIALDRRAYSVKGTRRGCMICGKNSSSGWVPLVYILSADES